MSARPTKQDVFPEWLELVRQNINPYDAANQLGITKKICQRWVRECGLQKKNGRPKPMKRKPKRIRKYHILDRLFSSPLGGYPNFLADYNAAPL